MIRRTPLALPRDRWRSRWLVTPTWNRLHRCMVLEVDEDDLPRAGVAVCGYSGPLAMPGFCSRVGLERCAHCCRILGIPRGKGAPYNSGEPYRDT